MSLFLAFALFTPAQVHSDLKAITQQSTAVNSIFKPVLPILQKKTRVPLRLPTYLATEGEEYPLHAIVEVATPTHYELQLAFTPDCTGGTACRYGTISGQAIRPSAKRLRGKTVKLAQGITGYFVDATCGANCSDSTLSWNQDGYRYTVGIKAEKMGTLIKVADSAIVSKGMVKP